MARQSTHGTILTIVLAGLAYAVYMYMTSWLLGETHPNHEEQKKIVPATWWWREALLAPEITPRWCVVEQHVCERRAECRTRSCTWSEQSTPWNTKSFMGETKGIWKDVTWGPPYINQTCGAGGEVEPSLFTRDEVGSGRMNRVRPTFWDGLGHTALQTFERIVKHMAVKQRTQRFFGEDVNIRMVYLEHVKGLIEGYTPSLYCHSRVDYMAIGVQAGIQYPEDIVFGGGDSGLSASLAKKTAKRSDIVFCLS